MGSTPARPVSCASDQTSGIRMTSVCASVLLCVCASLCAFLLQILRTPTYVTGCVQVSCLYTVVPKRKGQLQPEKGRSYHILLMTASAVYLSLGVCLSEWVCLCAIVVSVRIVRGRPKRSVLHIHTTDSREKWITASTDTSIDQKTPHKSIQ